MGMNKYLHLKNKDRYFLRGDNYKNSEDSRFFGPVEKSDIKYKVIN